MPQGCLKLLVMALLASAWAHYAAHTDSCPPAGDEATFEDDFSKPKLDTCRWSVVRENWGGKIGEEDYNGGVSPENVSVREGMLHLWALGDLYDGSVRGTGSGDRLREHGRRTGAAIRTRQHYTGGGLKRGWLSLANPAFARRCGPFSMSTCRQNRLAIMKSTLSSPGVSTSTRSLP